MKNICLWTNDSALIASYEGSSKTNTTFLDQSGNSQNLTITGTYSSDDGKYGMAFGSVIGNQATGTLGTTITGPCTVSFWMKMPVNIATTEDRRVVCLSNSFLPCVSPMFNSGSTQKPLLFKGTTNYKYFNGPGADGLWHHYAFVITGWAQTDINNDLLYIDGVQASVFIINTTGLTTVPTVNLIVGYQTEGSFDEVMIFNRVLNAQEIAYIASSPFSVVGYLRATTGR